MLSLQALVMVQLLLSHESSLRILCISPNKNWSEHWLYYSAYYLTVKLVLPMFQQIMSFHEFSIRRHFRKTLYDQCYIFTVLVNNCRWWYAFDASEYILLTRSKLCSYHKFENSIFNIYLLKNLLLSMLYEVLSQAFQFIFSFSVSTGELISTWLLRILASNLTEICCWHFEFVL